MKKYYKRKRFTLTELLVVIAIITILAGILMPTISHIIRSAKKTKAKAEMQSIITAVRSYEATYGVLPLPSGWSNANTGTSYNNLMELLTDVKIGGGTPTTYRNSRQIRFLDIPKDYTTSGFQDPWSNDFLIYIDTNYDGQVTGPDSETLYGTVFIYSTGPGTGTDDYVYSWK